MEKKTIVIDVQTDEGVKSLNRLESSFEDVYGEIQPLSGRIGELEDQLYEMANAGDTSSDAFKALSAEVGRMKKVIIDVDMEVDGLSMSFSQKLGGAIGGVASGFELVQGTFGALGAESEKVEEALLKVQSAMAIAQGVQGIREALPVWKNFGSVAVKALTSVRGAVMATGIGLLAVAIGLLVSNFDKIQEKAQKTSKTFNDWLNSSNTGAKALKAYLDALVYPITLLIKAYREIKDAILGTSDATRAVAARQREVHEQRVKQLDKEREKQDAALKGTLRGIDAEIKLRQAEGKSTIDLEIKKQEAIQKTSKLALESLAQQVKARLALGDVTEEEVAKFKDLINQNKEAYYNASLEIRTLSIQQKNERIANAQEASDKLKEIREKETEEARKQQDELNKLIIQAKNEELAKIEELDELIYQSKLTAQQKEIIALNDYYFEKIELAKQYGLDYQALEEERNKKVLEVNKKYEDERARKVAEIVQKVNDERKKQDDYDKQKAEEKRQRDEQYFELSKQTLTTFSELVDAFAGQDEASQKRAFKIKKAASIAQTTIETYQASQSAYASQMAIPTPDAPIRAAVAAGIAIASGLARVKAIASQQFSGGGSSSSAGGGGVSLPSAGSSATFNVVGNSNTNQIVEGINANPVQAYVVAGEVTTAQNLDRNRIKTATL